MSIPGMYKDVTFYVVGEVAGPSVFTMVVNSLESVREVKEKVQNRWRIPISHQNFIFNGHILQDHLCLYQFLIRQDASCIILHVIAAAPPPPPMFGQFFPKNIKNLEETLQVIPTPYNPSRIVALSMKAHKYWKHRFPMEANLDDTVLKLKKILLVDLRTLAGFEMQDVPVERMVLHSHSTRLELLDHQFLRDCQISDNHEIDLSIKK